MSEGKPATAANPKSARKWRPRVLIALAGLVVLLVLARGAFELWQYVVVPADAPRIAMSLDDTWLNELGIARATYDQAMARAGGKLVTLGPDDMGEAATDPPRIQELLADVDGLLLTGGGDVDPVLYGGDPREAEGVNRRRDDFEIALIREARRRALPILGICRGCQLLNVAHGGTLRNLRSEEAVKDTHFSFSGHSVRLEPESALAKVLGTTHLDEVESFHGQAVARPGTGVRVAARSEDGVIEAIEMGKMGEMGQAGTSWIVAVQWHPEMTVLDAQQLKLLKAFVSEARRVRKRREQAGR